MRAQILPKTLFGEQFVSLILPPDPAQALQQHGPLTNNTVIQQDRSKGALEAQTVLDHLYPVLTAVQPADLNATLTAVATALQGRGEKLGQTLVNLDDYLTSLNPHTQKLVDDLKKLGKVSLEYNNVAPDIFDALTNLETTVRTTVQKRQALDSLLTVGSSTSAVLSGFLENNRERLISVAGQGAKIFPLLAQYSPEFTCLFAGVNKLFVDASKTVYDHAIHLGATVDTSNQGKYVPGNQPRLVTGYGPNCFGLPNNPQPTVNGKFQIPGKYRCLNDGAALTEDPCAQRPSAAGYSALNSPEEDALVNSLIAGDMHTTPDKVPPVATMLAAPLLRGHQVVMK